MKTEWPHLLADLRTKRDALNQVIEMLETNFVVGTLEPDDEAEQPHREVRRSPVKAKKPGRPKNGRPRTKSVDKRTDGRTEQKPRPPATRSLPKQSAKEQAILEALTAKSPQTPGELMKRAGFRNLGGLRYCLMPLVARGVVVTVGNTASRQISLASSRQAKEEP